MMLCGTPNLKMIDLMKLTAVRAVELVIGTASIHLVNLSTTTNRCVLPHFDDFLSVPTMSSPHVANGHDSGMVLSSDAGVCGLLANFWQAMQRMNDVLCISRSGRPVQTCSKGLGHECATACVMSTGAFVNLEQ